MVAKSGSRSRLQVDERRSQLLALALDLFGDRSYEEISIDEIAKAAGISKGLLYHYFPSKRAFYVAALGAAAEQLREATDIEVPDGPVAQSIEGTRLGIDAYLAYVERRAKPYSFLLRGGGGADEEVRAIVEAMRHHYISKILDTLGRTEDDARLRTALRGWIGFVEHASLDWIDRRDLDRAEMTELLTAVCVAIVTTVIGPVP